MKRRNESKAKAEKKEGKKSPEKKKKRGAKI